MLVIDIDDIKLPRVNKKYNKDFSLTKEYRLRKRFLMELISIRGLKQIKPPYSVEIQVWTHLDIDSFVKPLFDAMESAGVIDNDKNILEFNVVKKKVKRTEKNGLRVWVDNLILDKSA